jgi:hypothetical protein
MSDHISLKNIEDTDFALAEYSALRDEILKRIEFQNQTLNLTLIIAGTAVSVAFQLSNGPIILLIYPPIALVLSAGWEQNNLRIRQIGIYIRERLEVRSSSGGWEHYRIRTRVKPTGTAHFARFAFIIKPDCNHRFIVASALIMDGITMDSDYPNCVRSDCRSRYWFYYKNDTTR